MKKKENYIFEADAIQMESIEAMTKERNLYRIGQALGITKNEIKSALKRNQNTIIAGAIVLTVSMIVGNTYYYTLGQHYAAVSIKDFNMFERFTRMLFGRFL